MSNFSKLMTAVLISEFEGSSVCIDSRILPKDCRSSDEKARTTILLRWRFDRAFKMEDRGPHETRFELGLCDGFLLSRLEFDGPSSFTSITWSFLPRFPASSSR